MLMIIYIYILYTLYLYKAIYRYRYIPVKRVYYTYNLVYNHSNGFMVFRCIMPVRVNLFFISGHTENRELYLHPKHVVLFCLSTIEMP